MMKTRAIAAFGLAVLIVSASAQARTLNVAAASDLQPVMPALAQAYEKATGVKLQISFASSSTLATQILNGAPMDVFLAADYSFPEQVVAAGLADEKEPMPYARGTLVLFARKDSPLQPISMEKLEDTRVTKIAVADEFHAPYGRAAYAAMRALKIYDRIKPKLVSAENITQTAQFVESGNAQLGFLSLTSAQTAHFREIGTYVLVPMVYPVLRQCAVAMKKSDHLEDARNFLKWLVSVKVQEHLKEFGLASVN